MQDGTKREAVSQTLSACFFLMTPRGFERLCLQHAAKERMHKSKENDSEKIKKGPKMIPKPLQNQSWRGSGGDLGTTLEARCF